MRHTQELTISVLLHQEVSHDLLESKVLAPLYGCLYADPFPGFPISPQGLTRRFLTESYGLTETRSGGPMAIVPASLSRLSFAVHPVQGDGPRRVDISLYGPLPDDFVSWLRQEWAPEVNPLVAQASSGIVIAVPAERQRADAVGELIVVGQTEATRLEKWVRWVLDVACPMPVIPAQRLKGIMARADLDAIWEKDPVDPEHGITRYQRPGQKATTKILSSLCDLEAESERAKRDTLTTVVRALLDRLGSRGPSQTPPDKDAELTVRVPVVDRGAPIDLYRLESLREYLTDSRHDTDHSAGLTSCGDESDVGEDSPKNEGSTPR